MIGIVYSIVKLPNFIQVCSLIVSIIVARAIIKNDSAARKHERLTVRPSLVLTADFAAENIKKGLHGQKISLHNAGTGPALISDYKVIYDGKLLLKNREWMITDDPNIFMKNAGIVGCNKISNLFLSPGEEKINILIFEYTDENDKNIKREKIKIDIQYESLYGDKFTASTH